MNDDSHRGAWVPARASSADLSEGCGTRKSARSGRERVELSPARGHPGPAAGGTSLYRPDGPQQHSLESQEFHI